MAKKKKETRIGIYSVKECLRAIRKNAENDRQSDDEVFNIFRNTAVCCKEDIIALMDELASWRWELLQREKKIFDKVRERMRSGGGQ